MLIQFSVKNYKCFKEEAKLSMVASNYDRTTRWTDNVIEVPKFNLNLLRSAVIYGANASGKSKLLDAMAFMQRFIFSSQKDTQVGERIKTEAFKLNTETENQPSLFEINFIIDSELFRYGFEVTQKVVVSEWLYHRLNTKEVEIFYRDYQTFDVHKKEKKLKLLVDNDMIRDNALLLSVAAQNNDKFAIKIFNWIKMRFNILTEDSRFLGYSISKLNEKDSKQEILQFLKNADFNIVDLKPVVVNAEELPNEMPKKLKELLLKKINEDGDSIFSDVSVFHKKYDADNKAVGIENFSLDDDESLGTKRFFALSGPIINTLKDGKTLVIDELDAKLHSNLVSKVVSFFNAPDTNPHNAQLIFNTHDRSLMSSELFRRDQVWFTKKDRYGAVTLYSLDGFKTDNGEKARNKEDYETNYARGKYGAIPYLSDFNPLFLTEKEIAHEE